MSDKPQIIDLGLGDSKRLSFNAQKGSVVLKKASGVRVYFVENEAWRQFEVGKSVSAPLPYDGFIRVEGIRPGSHKVVLKNKASGKPLRLLVNVARVRLAVDSNRVGVVDHRARSAAEWVWGPHGRGAVLLVNNCKDRDIRKVPPTRGKPSVWSELRVQPTGLKNGPDDLKLLLYATDRAARRFAVYDEEHNRILGQDRKVAQNPALAASPKTKPISISRPLSTTGATYFVEGHEYPGPEFEGLITVELWLTRGSTILATDRAVFRIAPWIMTPNNIPARTVFACNSKNGSNAKFLDELEIELKERAVGYRFVECDDLFIQDEIEFGYSQGARHHIPVFCVSPRKLDKPIEKELHAPDFGMFKIRHTTIQSSPSADCANQDRKKTTSLDSFGNLGVSPAVVVGKTKYPFGRIVFGGRPQGPFKRRDPRRTMPELRRFLYAQKIQAPFEIFTDWLHVGHVDEILCFVPAPNEKGFQILVASPTRAWAVLERVDSQDGGNLKMFAWGEKKRVFKVLKDSAFRKKNEEYQGCMDLNLEILSRELDVDDRHLIQIPVLFREKQSRAVAYFPNMVNHLVLGNTSLVPKPYGPKIGGKCAFETAFKKAVPSRDVVFIDDQPYHGKDGEIHCATNTLREKWPMNWWDYKPHRGYDV